MKFTKFIFPELEDRMINLLANGAEELEKDLFSNGEILEKIIIEPNIQEGYNIKEYTKDL